LLFGSSTAHKEIRRMVVRTTLDAIVKLPSGGFRPYAAYQPHLFFTKTNSGHRFMSGSTTAKRMDFR